MSARTWIVVVVAAAAIGATATIAEAKPKKARPVVRQRKQKRRIKAGVKDGSLTKKEAARLAKEQKRIQAHKEKAKEDGVVTKKERALLTKEHNKASAHIAKERHDAQGETAPKPPAGPNADPGVNARQHRQRHRIAQGIKSDSLTKREAKLLIRQEKKIAAIEEKFKSDGKLTAREHKTLHKLLNETSEMIWKQKHDGQERPKLKPAIVEKIENGEITGAEAKALYAKMRRVRKLRRLLGGAPLSEEKRAELEAEYDALVESLHKLHEQATSPAIDPPQERYQR